MQGAFSVASKRSKRLSLRSLKELHCACRSLRQRQVICRACRSRATLETQGGWRSTYFRIGMEPDKNPFAALARALSPLLGDGDVVDQMTRAQKLANSLARAIFLLFMSSDNVAQRTLASASFSLPTNSRKFSHSFRMRRAQPLHRCTDSGIPRSSPGRDAGRLPCVDAPRRLRQSGLSYRPLADQTEGPS